MSSRSRGLLLWGHGSFSLSVWHVVSVLISGLMLLACPEQSSAETPAAAESVLAPETEVFDIYQGAIPVRQFSFEYADDRDYDKQPDDWIRRRGVDFRQYVQAEIDYRHAAAGKRSLRIDANGSGAIYYSPPVRIDPRYCYILQAAVLTEGLRYNAAAVSFSFLNEKKQRVKRVITTPVSGTHQAWQYLRLPPILPDPEVCFVVVGCHLLPSQNMDIQGSAWFDEISISKLPRLSLASNFESQFQQSQAPVLIRSRVSGLDQVDGQQTFQYRLRQQVEDVTGAVLHESEQTLEPETLTAMTPHGAAEQEGGAGEHRIWELPAYPPGFYRVRAVLWRNDLPILQKSTSFAVMNRLGRAPLRGEFGWNLPDSSARIQETELLAIIREAGINGIKLPVWRQVAAAVHPSSTGEFLTALQNQSISVVGMLSHPPEEIRRKFSEDWGGVCEVFTCPPELWRHSASQVMALYSPMVSSWQLGDDHDLSFSGLSDYPRQLENIRRELQRIGQIRQLGVRWSSTAAVQQDRSLQRNFFTVVFDESENYDSISRIVQEIQAAGYEAWVVVKPDREQAGQTAEERANRLVRRLIDAKRTGCQRIFAWDVFDPEYGLLKTDGSPAELFLAWRTVALALNDTQYAGSIQLPGRSENHVFFRDSEAVMVVWNKEPTLEELYLGDHVTHQRVWGDQEKIPGDPTTGRQSLAVSQQPMILTGCSQELMQWRMGVRFSQGEMANSSTTHEDSLQVANPFPYAVQGTLTLLPENGWEMQPHEIPLNLPAEAEALFPVEIKLPAYSLTGEQLLTLEFDLTGNIFPHPFRVYYDYGTGAGDLKSEIVLQRTAEGGLLIEQTILNQSDPAETFDLRCFLLSRGERRQIRNVDGLAAGQSRKIVYLIPQPDSLPAQEFWLRLEQKNGRRVVNQLLNEKQVELGTRR